MRVIQGHLRLQLARIQKVKTSQPGLAVIYTPYSQNIRTRLPTGGYASTIAALRLVFRPTITDTHRQYGRKAAGER